MIDIQDIIAAVEASLQELQGGSDPQSCGLFLVEAKAHGDEIEVFIDCDARGADGRARGVTVDDCVVLTKAIEGRFDRDENDFSLTVSSAGIGQPLRVLRQYRKLIGRQLEVVLVSGTKFIATLEAVDENGIMTLSYLEKQRVEGKKRYEKVTKTADFAPETVKKCMEYIDFR